MRILVAIQGHHNNLAAVEEDAQPNIRETIEGVLGPLVRIWDSRIYLVHQSLKEFLLGLSTQTEDPLSAMYGIDPARASLVLADTCVSYLSLEDLKEDLFSRDWSSITESPTSPISLSKQVECVDQVWDPFGLAEDQFFKDPAILEAEVCASIRTQYPLFDYAARYWADHFSTASSISPPEMQESVHLLSDGTTCRGLNWLRYYWLHAETNLSCPRNFVPFITASYFGHTQMVLSLLCEEIPINSDIGACGIYWASRMGHHEVVDHLLHRNFSPDAMVFDGRNSLIAAIHFNHLDVVKRLLEGTGFIPEQEQYRVNQAVIGGRTPLSIAAGNGSVEIVTQLLQHNHIQPDIPDFAQWTPLFWSVGGKHLDVLRLLITDDRVSANHVDKTGRNIISWAASTGELELVKYLLSLKLINVDEPDHNGRTAFSWAAGNGHLETVILLRRSRLVSLSRKDNDGRNALSWACSGGHYKTVEYLIKYDREGINEEDLDGWTPLSWALFSQTPKTIQVLLSSGLVDVNRRDSRGRSALSFAAGYGYLDVVLLLLSTKGIDTDSEDNHGRTPLSYATRYPEIVSALQQSQKEI